MLSLNDEIKKISATFFQYRNDIDIYTEDKQDSKEFYKTLFRRLLTNTGIKINDVTPIGPKKDVVKFCKEDANVTRKKLYIIDGDFNIINESVEVHKDLFVLNSYCVENFIIDSESICNYIFISCGVKSIDDIENELNYKDWLSEYSESFIELFLHFAILDKIQLRFMIYNANKFLNKGKVEKTLVQKEIDDTKKYILTKITLGEYETELKYLRSKWPDNIDSMLSIVSGKDYLIPIVLSKLIEFKSSSAKPSLDEAKMHLLLFGKLDRLADLKNRIETINNA